MDHSPSTPIPFTDLPEGTVTFLFTDIEGSTRLLEQLREGYATLLADQRRILREAFAVWQGREVDTQGDAFFVAFSRATQAVCAAAQAQRALAEHAWPQGVIVRVRMGIHTGEPWSGEEGYVGMDVHRAARIAHVGHGGQVLLSETSTALVQDQLPQGVSLLDMARHLLKDIHRPERICQLVLEGLPAEFPPLTSLEMLPPESARPPRQVGQCPYRGLAAFQEADAAFYFGRESFVDALEQAVHTKKLVAVIVGSSGSGKSSALFAGLLPRLREAGGYQFASFRPGTQPFYALAGALLPLLEPGLSEAERLVETGKLAEPLSKSEVHLSQVIERILEKNKGTRQLLLVADQFEELYTLCPDERLQAAFVDELLRMVEVSRHSRDGSAVILLTLRADFMGQALAHRPFADALQEASLLMGPMTRQELRVAIEQPAEMQGAAFEAGLVERILDDVGEKPGNLPLLEFTLTQLWEQQTDGWLAHADYEAMGCVEGALAAYADQVYAGLDAQGQELARRALVQLVQPGEGTEDTRRIATKEELGEESWQLIQRLADRRLVVTGRDAQGRETAEVVHEALIQKWGRFHEWMDSDRSFRAWQERLRGSLRQWQESEQDEGALLGGAPLLVAENWLSERSSELSESEQEFILSGVALREHKEAEREAQRQRELELAQKLAWQAAILLASQAESEIALGNTDRAVLLALAALQDYPYTPQAEHALGQAVTYNRSLALYEGHSAAVTGAAWSSDGRRIATSSSDNSVQIWEADTGQLIRQIDLPRGITGNIYDMGLAVQWSPDDRYLLTISGDRFLTGSQDYDLILWDAETGEQVTAQEVQNSTPPSTGELGTTGAHFTTGAGAAFAGDGRLATLGGDNTALIWEPMLANQPLALSGHTGGVNTVAWSPDFTRLATASEDGSARVWDAVSGQEQMQLIGHSGEGYGWIGAGYSGSVNQVAWSPNGSLLATAGKDGSVWFWDGASGEVQTSIQPVPSGGSSAASERIVYSLAWSPDGRYLTTGSGDGYIRVWEVSSGEKTIEVRAHEQYVTFLAWSPLEERLVSAGADGRARVWNVARDNMLLSLPYGNINTGDWFPDGKTFIVGTDGITPGPDKSFEGVVALWDINSGKPIFETSADKDKTWSWLTEFSPDGKFILARPQLQWPDMTDANSYYVLDSQNGEILRKLETGKDTLLMVPGVSLDGTLAAAGDIEGTFYFWEVSSGELVNTLTCLSFAKIIQWSPDGRKIAMLCVDFGQAINIIQVLNAQTFETLLRIEGDRKSQPYNWIRWSPDSTRISVGGGDDEVGSLTNPVYVYDASSGEELLKIVKHTGQAFRIDWSPDGKRLASGSSDDTTRIWDAQTGAELLTLSTPGDWAINPAWSPDGKYLLVTILNISSPGQSGVWRVWQSTQELIDYAKECCVFRELTEAERAQFGLK
jgi:WD40 repeat protein/class 3 adenylate cyclase